MIYLDYNATTPMDDAVVAAMTPFLHKHFGNPSSSHPVGLAARAAIASARGRVAALIGATPAEIVFTGGGTEASNLAIKGAAWAGGRRGGHVVTTAVEHPATLGPLQFLERFGVTRTEVGVDRHGRVEPKAIRAAIRPDTFLISALQAQNEVGTLQPIAAIGAIARAAGVLFHVDAAQSAGKVPVDVTAMNVDLLSVAGHKFYGPKGVGALFVRRGVELEPLLHGAGHEGGRRSGTENVAAIVGLGEAARLAKEHLPDARVGQLRDRFWSRLREGLGERVVLNGHPTERLPGTLSVSFPGWVGGELLAKLDGVCASTGAACHSGDAHPSPTLMAMGVPREQAIGTIRFSVGRMTTEAEIDDVSGRLVGIVRSKG